MQFDCYEFVVRSIEFKAFFEIITIGDSKILMSVFFSGQKENPKDVVNNRSRNCLS